MSENMSIDYYNKNAQAFFEGTVDADMSELYRKFLAYVPIGGHILDAGCGSGRDSVAFLKMGYKVTAFDASEEMVRLSSELTRPYAGKPTRLLTFQEFDDIGSYDAIWASASLLHVSYREMDKVIDKLITALKRGGVLYVSFKCGEGSVQRDGRVFAMYTEEALKEHMDKHMGIKMIDLWTTNDVRGNHEGDVWVNGLWIRTGESEIVNHNDTTN